MKFSNFFHEIKKILKKSTSKPFSKVWTNLKKFLLFCIATKKWQYRRLQRFWNCQLLLSQKCTPLLLFNVGIMCVEKITMNNKLLKIGIDLDDTIIYCPHFFSLMTNATKDCAEIHIITNREQTPESESHGRNELSELGIYYHHLVVTGDKAEYILTKERNCCLFRWYWWILSQLAGISSGFQNPGNLAFWFWETSLELQQPNWTEYPVNIVNNMNVLESL